MSEPSIPREDVQGSPHANVSPLASPHTPPAAMQPPQQQQPSVHPPVASVSPIANTGTTPRLLFTWDPYRNVSSSPGHSGTATGGAAMKPPEEEVAEEGRLASSIGGCSTTSSVNNANAGAETSAGASSATRGANASAAPSPAATPGGARPPLTISALLGGAGYQNRGSPQLSATTMPLPPQQQILHQSPLSEACVAPGSTHSTPSGPVLKRISTSAKDGRQYFLDYSPSPTVNSGPPAAVAGGGMPNLMLPPNMSHMGTVSSASAPTSSQQRPQPPAGMDTIDLDGGSSANISPQAVPLMSPPRGSSSAGSHPSYGSVTTANSHSILSATQLSSMGGMTQHNPYRSPSMFYAPAHNTSPATQQQQQQVLHHQDIDDNDADLVYALESDPSAFIVRLLPPPPPLPELARVLTVPGVVQSLCARWCTYVAAVLKSDAFAAITAAPPPPPSSVTMSREGGNGSTKEELAAWYETAVDWWEKLEQEGTGAVDVRAKSRTVAAAVDAVASGRSRRASAPTTGGNANGGRYQPQGGVGGSGYRGRGGRSGGGYHAGMGAYGYAASTTGHRGGTHPRGGGAAAAGGMAAGAHNTCVAAAGYRGGRGSGGSSAGYSYDASMAGGDNRQDIPDEVDPAMQCSNAYYPSSNFNPYAESWHFSGTAGMATGTQQQQLQQQQMPSPYMKGGRPLAQNSHQQPRGYGAMNM
ncbi:hypothetical protein LSCM1_06901 [Leishmania martiniquensis]|uniref:Uncharacterized protein n=1 Tax=Leishmania martiniquensis TaxID=1580590 RepID=A0A836KPH9_9TRYP|nr:hypothetical protein LSCM1_06901 [Leishmania martiniquensis]